MTVLKVVSTGTNQERCGLGLAGVTRSINLNSVPRLARDVEFVLIGRSMACDSVRRLH